MNYEKKTSMRVECSMEIFLTSAVVELDKQNVHSILSFLYNGNFKLIEHLEAPKATLYQTYKELVCIIWMEQNCVGIVYRYHV